MEPERTFEIYYKVVKAIDGMIEEARYVALDLVLDAEALALYEQTACALKQAILQQPPDTSHLHRLLGHLTFLGTADTPLHVEKHALYLANRMSVYVPTLLQFLWLYLEEASKAAPEP